MPVQSRIPGIAVRFFHQLRPGLNGDAYDSCSGHGPFLRALSSRVSGFATRSRCFIAGDQSIVFADAAETLPYPECFHLHIHRSRLMPAQNTALRSNQLRERLQKVNICPPEKRKRACPPNATRNTMKSRKSQGNSGDNGGPATPDPPRRTGIAQ